MYLASQSLFTQIVWKRAACACSDFTTCHDSQYSALKPFTTTPQKPLQHAGERIGP